MEPQHTSNSDSPLTPLVALAGLAILGVPLFLRMPLTNDAEVYDLQASVVRDGGILYRDLLEPNLPGAVAVHLIVRSLLGESSEVLRLFDLGLFAVTLMAAAWLVRSSGGTWRTAAWTMFALAAFYFSASEWCHCQRDVWMLPFALMAMGFRLSRDPKSQSLGLPYLEGILWGCAVWLKPHVAIPAAAVWLVSGLFASCRRAWLRDAWACLTGGLTMGALGVGVMWGTGCWPYFLDTVRNWNGAYFAAGRAHWTWQRLLGAGFRFAPWSLLHLAAVVILVRVAFNCRRRAETMTANSGWRNGMAIVGAAYVGWTIQAVALQHPFDYVFAPSMMLAVLLIALRCIQQRPGGTWARNAWLTFALVVVLNSPLTDFRRLRLWSTCITGPVHAAVRDELSHFQNPDQQDLQRVADYLQQAAVRGKDVCLYNSDFVSLYVKLNLRPPTRYAYLFETLQFFPDRRRSIVDELECTPHRFVVTDLVSCGMPRRQAEVIGEAGASAPPPAYESAPKGVYPWKYPVIYRAGTYLVHRVDAAAARESRVLTQHGGRTLLPR